MGRSSSSKRTSSKKKGDKISSRKKSKRKESKKRHRDYDSDSSFSDDNSLNSKPSSSSASQPDYRRRIKKSNKKHHRRDHSVSSFSDDHSISPDSKSRKRKRSQISSKSSKKRVRKRYSSPDSDADAERVRKQKRSTRETVKPKKKSSKKKKSKKHYSSSSNSDSQSGGGTNNADTKDQKSKAIMPGKKHKVRSPSCSIDETLALVNNSRRLKSVITIVSPPREEEVDKLEKDEHKEEIAYDFDDYPSPRSLDSNEGGNNTESDNHSHGTSNKRIRVENIESGEIVTELGKSASRQNDQESTNSLVKEQESYMCSPIAALGGGGDLESILRQKALENLRKYKVGIPKTIPNKNANNEYDVKEPSSKSADIVENKLIKLDSPDTQGVNKRSGLMEVVKKHPEGEHVAKEPEIYKQTILGCSEEKSASPNAGLVRAVSTSNVNASTSSAAEPASSGKHSSEEQPSEANAGSEYEKKTMSVMRGGEMVQVSYKVYIPKRAPALGRRQLRR